MRKSFAIAIKTSNFILTIENMGGRGRNGTGEVPDINVVNFNSQLTPQYFQKYSNYFEKYGVDKMREKVQSANDNYNKIANAESLYGKLKDFANKKGYKVNENDSDRGANGTTYYKADGTVDIAISRNLSTEGKIKTLAHEIAHAELHKPGSSTNPLNRGMKEAEAEMTGYMFAKSNGINTDNYSIHYVNGWLNREGVQYNYVNGAFTKVNPLYTEMMQGTR
ncbi:ImmA/IrrE family metallo-endopeptidase [Scytonema sp. UIC 10036]|uniref:ImmA/IrrE family metallo-endopeptidase n=1 Tax=Scytonema sp. UIC 10036 TaxID=2304196 RepID=UPI0012DA64C4|nr:ImmA/IrrE family metallo-endopeptidase [Scytonema sp. UIC 10036]MUG92746.1 ImmA/IrrE family metallo-endopeptidase [Scytonema sp. UIC 10036]